MSDQTTESRPASAGQPEHTCLGTKHTLLRLKRHGPARLHKCVCASVAGLPMRFAASPRSSLEVSTKSPSSDPETGLLDACRRGQSRDWRATSGKREPN